MYRSSSWKYWLLSVIGGGTLWGSACSTDLSDALRSGVFDFVSGTVVSVLTQMLGVGPA